MHAANVELYRRQAAGRDGQVWVRFRPVTREACARFAE
jgi:hypothetical protein